MMISVLSGGVWDLFLVSHLLILTLCVAHEQYFIKHGPGITEL